MYFESEIQIFHDTYTLTKYKFVTITNIFL